MKLLFTALIFLASNIAFSLELNKPAPPFKLFALANAGEEKSISLSQYRGKVVYLDFWASWCAPCRKSIPALKQLREQYADKGFEVVAINMDENIEDALEAVQHHNIQYPVIWHPSGKISDQYDLQGMPSAFIIDKQGLVQHVHVGYRESDTKEIASLIEKYLAQ